MNRDQARTIEWDCGQVLTRFFNHFDGWRYDAMADLFAPDGVWHRMGKVLRGRPAIMDALNARSRTQTVRHVVTNVQIDPESETSAEFVLYVTAYQHDSGTKPSAPPKIRAPYLLLVVPGKMAKVGNDWRIASMAMNREFEFES